MAFLRVMDEILHLSALAHMVCGAGSPFLSRHWPRFRRPALSAHHTLQVEEARLAVFRRKLKLQKDSKHALFVAPFDMNLFFSPYIPFFLNDRSAR